MNKYNNNENYQSYLHKPLLKKKKKKEFSFHASFALETNPIYHF